HADDLRLCDGELLGQFDPRAWLLHQELHSRWHDQFRCPDRSGWVHDGGERDPGGIVEDRAIDADQHDYSVLLTCILRRAISFGTACSNSFGDPRLRRNRGDDHRIARADLHPISRLHILNPQLFYYWTVLKSA